MLPGDRTLPKTVGEKHQLWQCYKLHVESAFLHTAHESGPNKHSRDLSSEDQHVVDQCMRLFPAIDPDTEVDHPKWIEVQSSVYKKGVFLLLQEDVMSPEFGKIVDIVQFSDTVIFLCKFFCQNILILIITPLY